MCRRVRPVSCYEMQSSSPMTFTSERNIDDCIPKWNSDQNNNPFAAEQCGNEAAKENCARGQQQQQQQQAVGKTPSYVPSYIRSVGFECNRAKPAPRQTGTDAPKRVSFSEVLPTRNRRQRRTHSSSCATNSTGRQRWQHHQSTTDLKFPSQSKRASDIVRVRDAVAAMEARINDVNGGATTFEKTRPAKVVLRSNKDPDATRKASYRRSMSDPNLNKKTVKEMKEIWNQKLDTEKQTNLSESAARSGGSNSSLNSVGSSKSIEKRITSRSENVQSAEKPPTYLSNSSGTENFPKLPIFKPPKVSPRPKGHVLRPRSVTVGHLALSETLNSGDNFERIRNQVSSPPPTEQLSVSQKAQLFGEVKTRVRRRANTRSPSPSYRRSWSEESSKQSSESSMDSTSSEVNHEHPFPYRSKRDEELISIIEKRRARREKKEEEDRMVTDLQKHAKHAKDRRKNRSINNSSAISTPSDDEDKEKTPNYLLNGVRRRSRDNVRVNPQKQTSQVAIQKTENSIFGASTVVQTDNSSKMAAQIDYSAGRRISALHKLLENKTSDTPVILNGQVQREKETSDPEAEDQEDSHLIPVSDRPKNLALKPFRGRAETEGSNIDRPAVILDESFERSNSLGKVDLSKSKTRESPPTPDKRSSGFSEEDTEDKESFATSGQIASKSPEDAEEVQSPNMDSSSDDTIHPSSGSTDPSSPVLTESTKKSSLSKMDLMEEYEKIAKELDAEGDENHLKLEKARPVSENSSTMSLDSGYRNSLEERAAKRWSDFTENSSDDEGSILDTPSEKPEEMGSPPSPVASVKETIEVKLHNIAKELLSTEESYVAVLHLVDQVFHKQILDAAVNKHIIPEQVVGKIFAHVPAIYRFHSDFLLPQLKERLANWENDPRFGDIMTRAAPFLKMYSLYVQHFDEAMKLIKLWSEKSNGFSSIIKAIQKTPECNCLTLQHHMLGPVQRVPRYRMLLEDYVKRLPEDSPDRGDAESALNLITIAATHSNETMKKIEKFHKLVNIFNNLSDVNFDIVDVSRELLKEGKIIKISARNGEKYERYLYLFSDMLLCCTPHRRLGKNYKVSAKIDLDGMTVNEIANTNLPFSFCVNGLQKAMEFATITQDEKDNWMKAIHNAIEDRKDRQRTFRITNDQTQTDDALSPLQAPATGSSPLPSPMQHKQLIPSIDMDDSELGTRAPRWIKDHEVAVCMCCSKSFNKLLRRRHHCRSCGRVICSECSENKATLQYDRSKPMKVCSKCYNVLIGRRRSETLEGERKGVLEVPAGAVSEKSVIANYLYFSDNLKKKGWAKTWCVIPEDELCLYAFGAHQDVRAQMTMPLPGFEVETVEFPEHKFSFRLSQAKTVFYFACNEQLVVERWKYALAQGSRGYDLSKKDVERLGRPVSSSESDDNEEEEKEEIVEEMEETLEDDNRGDVEEMRKSDAGEDSPVESLSGESNNKETINHKNNDITIIIEETS